MKKLISLVLLSIFLLTGCGSSENSDMIQVWVQVAEGTDEALVYKDAVDRYNAENPDSTQAYIEYIPRDASGGGYEDKINAAISSGDLPDVIAIDGPNLSSYVKSDLIVPLTGIEQEKLDDVVDGAIQANTIDDQLYALGAKDDTVMLYYNEDLVDSSLLSTDVENPSTWEDVFEICDQLSASQADNPDWVCIDYNLSFDEWAAYSLLPIFESNGVDLISEDGLVADGYFNSQAVADTFADIKAAFDNGYLSTASTGELQRFTQGNSAFRLDGSWQIPYYDEEFSDLNYGTTLFPVTKNWDGEPYVMNASWVFSVSSSSQYPEEAAQVVSYMTDATAGVKMYDALNSIPNSKSAQEEISSKVTEEYNLAMQQVSANAKSRPQTPSYPVFSKQFALSLDQVINTDSSPIDILNQNIVPLNSDLMRFANE